MYVDGTSHQPLVDEVQAASHRNRDTKSNSAFGDVTRQNSLYLPEMSYPAHILQDSFERIQEEKAAEVAYRSTQIPTHVAGVLDELRGTLGSGYHDDIARLESDIRTKGLPLVSANHDAVVYQSFIKAYDRVSVNHGAAPDAGAHALLDTAG